MTTANRSDGSTRRAGRAGGSFLALVLVLAASTPKAQAMDFRLRWRSGPGGGAAGYRLHVREEGASFGQPVSVGLPALAADGTMSAMLTGLQVGPRYYFAVSAVAANGDASGLSNQISTCTVDSQCDDLNPCTNDTCAAGSCRSTAVTNGTPCADGNRCNGDEACQQGICTRGPALNCTDGNACTIDACSPPIGCTYTSITGCRPCQTAAQCDDGNPCTTDTCTQRGTCNNVLVGSCSGCTVDQQCDDHNSCTIDACTGGRCHSTSRPSGASCSDGNPCNGEETCQAGRCKAGAFPCDDHDACTMDRCSADDGCLYETGASCATCESVPQGTFEAKWIALYSASSGERLTGMGVLDPAAPVNPTHTGIVMEVRDRESTNDVVYRIFAPPSVFKSNPSRRSFRLDSRRARQLRADGLRRLSIVLAGDGTVRVYFRAKSPKFGAPLSKGYTWSVNFGDHCGVSDCILGKRHARCA